MIKKIFAVLLLLAFSNQAIASHDLSVFEVKAKTLNVRKGPGTQHGKLKEGLYLRKGEFYVSQESSNRWKNISVMGLEGWSSQGSNSSLMEELNYDELEVGIFEVGTPTKLYFQEADGSYSVETKLLGRQFYVFVDEKSNADGDIWLKIISNRRIFWVSHAEVEIIKELGVEGTEPEQCEAGEIWDGYECVSEHETCEADETWDGYECVPNDCAFDEIWNGVRCVPIQDTCDYDETWDGYRCVPNRDSCQFNERWNGYECVPKDEDCDFGEIWDGYRCIPEREQCRWDETWNGYECAPNEEQCSRDEIWNGRHCIPERRSCDWNERWNGHRCVPKSGRCDRHERWNGYRCVQRGNHGGGNGGNHGGGHGGGSNCRDVVQDLVSCSEYAGQFGIPARATQGQASWTKNSCTDEVTYLGGCSRPQERCEEVSQTPVSCSEYAGQYGIPARATQGRASWTQNSCTDEITYLGGCSVPRERCEEVRQSPVSCSSYAGSYGIPSNATQGSASWTQNSCTDEITYLGGCSVPRERCEEVRQSPVSCSSYAGSYGIPSNATQGSASWTQNSCTDEITYLGGCSVPRERCEEVRQSPVSCSSYAGSYGIPSNATQGSASWTQNSCTDEITYLGGCSVPRERCEEVRQSPVSCSSYAGSYGIPADATRGSASWTQNSCTGAITYTGGCH